MRPITREWLAVQLATNPEPELPLLACSPEIFKEITMAETKPEYGWLIEHNDYSGGHRWLRAVRDLNGDRNPTIRLELTPDAIVALRFARKEDADAFIYLHPEVTLNCRATDHQFGV